MDKLIKTKLASCKKNGSIFKYKDNKVLFMHSGKMEVFIKHSIGSASENNWIMPVMKPYEMVDSILKRKAKLYQFYSN